MFLGSLAVGLKALGPVEQSRRRQLEFTADASHELRTPLSVISARPTSRSPARAARRAIGVADPDPAEGKAAAADRQGPAVAARSDSQPPPPGDEPLDVATIADTCAGRFRAVAGARSVTITADTETPAPALISAPPESIDRLAGGAIDKRVATRARAAPYASASRDGAGSAWPSRTTARAFRRRNGPGCSTASTGRPMIARAPGSGWPSRTRSCGPRGAAGTSAARRRSGVPGWPCHGAATSRRHLPAPPAAAWYPGHDQAADDEARQVTAGLGPAGYGTGTPGNVASAGRGKLAARRSAAAR